MTSRLSLFFALSASLGLLGCNEKSVVLCPSAAVLTDTATATVLRPGAPADPSGEAFTAYLMDADTDCALDKLAGETTSSLTLNFRATRPPSRDAATYSVPYFVAVNQAERVISKQMLTVQFNFAPGAISATAQETLSKLVLTLENGHLPTDYQYLAGFQLSEAQRAYNQKYGRYLP